MNDVTITLGKRVSQSYIDKVISETGVFNIQVQNFYSGTLPAQALPLDIAALPLSHQNAWKQIIDGCTFLFENGLYVWNILRDDHLFNLSTSCIRALLSTKDPSPEIPDGTPIKVMFEVPRFESNEVVEISLWYNQNFNPADLAALAAVGIVLTGNGRIFSVANDVEFRIGFLKPETVTEDYIIFNESNNTVIKP